jgi:hypothetical protein
VRGGILVSWPRSIDGNGTVKRPLQIISVDDNSTESTAEQITKGLIDGSLLGSMGSCGTGAGIDFVLGPYSGALTEPAAKVTHAQGKLLVATATATSIYVNRSVACSSRSGAPLRLDMRFLMGRRPCRASRLLAPWVYSSESWCRSSM